MTSCSLKFNVKLYYSDKMITDNSNGRLDDIQAFAKEKNLLESLKETFSRLKPIPIKVVQ